jgi:hypothetical protein
MADESCAAQTAGGGAVGSRAWEVRGSRRSSRRPSGPVDFHSWRRAYTQALADAGTNAQHATALAGHASLSAHARYLARCGRALEAPEGAMPDWDSSDFQQAGAAEEQTPDRVAGDVSFASGDAPGNRKKVRNKLSGADGTRTRGLRRDRPAL